MNHGRVAVWGVAAAVVATTLLAGPALGITDLTRPTPALGDGNATVTDVSVVDGPTIEAGRFGTDVRYLRGPTVRATVDGVSGTPRLIVHLTVPAMDVDESVSTLLVAADRGERRLEIPDRPLDGAPPDDSVTATTTVRLQSFGGDRILHEANWTVGGRP